MPWERLRKNIAKWLLLCLFSVCAKLTVAITDALLYEETHVPV